MKVDKMEDEVQDAGRVPTGIPGFDELIEGGLVKKSTVIISGGCGVGKSTFATQFIHNRAAAGEPCLYVTFEQSAQSIRTSAMRFGMDLKALEDQGLLVILEVDPSKVMNLVKEGYGQIVEEVRKGKMSNVVIDSISSFEIMLRDEFEKRRALINFAKWLKTRNCTSLMISENPEDITKRTIRGAAQSIIADGVVVLCDVLKKNTRNRALTVIKMRETNVNRKICPYRFKSSGIVVYPRENVLGGVIVED